MPAPIQDIHLQPRSVRQLNEKNAIARNRVQRLEIRLAGVSVKAVENKPDRRVVGAPDDFPGIAIIVDVTPPGERLEANAQAALRCPFAKLVKICRTAVYAAKGVRRNVAADQQRITAELLHEVEFALGAIECALTLRLRHAFKVAERLKGDCTQSPVGHFSGDVSRRAVIRKQVAFKNFDTAKAGCRNRRQLFAQAAAEANGGNRRSHCFCPPLLPQLGALNAASRASYPVANAR